MISRPSQTKTRILKAARTLFSSHGYESTTIDDIITACGITKGAFYHHFKSKQALCEMVIDQLQSDYQQLVAEVEADIAPIEQLRQLINKITQLNSSGEWVNCRLILRLSMDPCAEHDRVRPKLAGFWQWYGQVYEDLIQKCRGAGEINTKASPAAQLQILLITLAGAVVFNSINPDTPLAVDISERVIKALQSD